MEGKREREGGEREVVSSGVVPCTVSVTVALFESNHHSVRVSTSLNIGTIHRYHLMEHRYHT